MPTHPLIIEVTDETLVRNLTSGFMPVMPDTATLQERIEAFCGALLSESVHGMRVRPLDRGYPVFEVTIRTDNAAFVDGDDHAEVARLLRKAADMVENDARHDGKLFDANGNHVGDFQWTDA